MFSGFVDDPPYGTRIFAIRLCLTILQTFFCQRISRDLQWLEHTSDSLTPVVPRRSQIEPPLPCFGELVETSAQNHNKMLHPLKFETKTMDILPDSQYSKIQIQFCKI